MDIPGLSRAVLSAHEDARVSDDALGFLHCPKELAVDLNISRLKELRFFFRQSKVSEEGIDCYLLFLDSMTITNE